MSQYSLSPAGSKSAANELYPQKMAMEARVEDLSRINFVFIVRQAGNFLSLIGDLKLKNSLQVMATQTAEAMEDFKGNCDSLKFLREEHG